MSATEKEAKSTPPRDVIDLDTELENAVRRAHDIAATLTLMSTSEQVDKHTGAAIHLMGRNVEELASQLGKIYAEAHAKGI